MAVYNSQNEFEKRKAKERFKWLIENRKTFELTEKKLKRSLSQNRYLHLILGWFAIEYGDTLEFVKQDIFKKIVNVDIFKTEFVNKKTGEIREDWRSSAKLDSAEMTTAIERFRNYSSKELGLYLPEPSEMEFLQQIEKELDNYKNWL